MAVEKITRFVWTGKPLYTLTGAEKDAERNARATAIAIREDDIWNRRQAGETFRSLGDRWDISTERARQIYKKRYSSENYENG